MITDDELKDLEACQSADDWSAATNKIKAVRGGMYPDDWWDKVKLSGLMDRIMDRWGENSDLTLTRTTS